MADKALDDKPYHTAYEDVTWEKSTLRSWLNGYGASSNKQNRDYSKQNFIQTAFDSSEQTYIMDSQVENRDSVHSAGKGGNDTVDKVFLLSESEAFVEEEGSKGAAEKYGFSGEGDADEARRAKSSSYTKAMGVGSGNWHDHSYSTGNCSWWLRSPAKENDCAKLVEENGSTVFYMEPVDAPLGIRPVLKIDLAAVSDEDSVMPYAYAGKVCSDGSVKEMDLNGIAFSAPRIIKDDSDDTAMVSGQKVTWDCVWFGNYPQAEVVPASEEYTALGKELLQEGDLVRDDELYQKLKSATGWDEQGDVEIDNQRYRRIKEVDARYSGSTRESYYQWENDTDYHYFQYQPIKWRTLSVNGTQAFLVADKVLDNQYYHDDRRNEDEEWEWDAITWEESTVRSWLNGYGASANQQKKDYGSNSFINTAFGSSARTTIKDTQVENKDNLSYGTEGGKDTVDKVFLLSESEVCTDNAKAYGFSSSDYGDEARWAKSSVYAKALGTESESDDAFGYIGNCEWLLRSPGYASNDVAYVDSDGWGYRHYDFGDDHDDGIRPALNLNLASLSNAESSNLWSYAGTVCSDGTVNEVSSGGQPSDDNKQDKATGVNVAYRTQKEIRDYAKKSGVLLKDALTFSENPITAEPYALGKLSDKTLKSAADMLNQIRYIAGIPDGVELSDSYNELAQAAALSNYANNDLSHFPVQLAGMPDDMYALAKEGASSSNISWASWAGRSLNDTIVSGWMKDGSDGNIPMVGHRRWILNPSMGKTGFGAVSGRNGTYSAMYTFDRSNSGAQEYGVMW